jgi:hypothetical protein
VKVTNFGPDGLPITLAGWSTGVTSLNSNVDITGGGPSALNFVQRITSNTSNTLLNPIVNFASGSNIAFAVQSNTLTISGQAGGGGAAAVISAGSNSTRVSEISTAGASTTLWSPFDHAHDGIGTITASSSNTMQRGTWNVRPGAGIALNLTDSDGDGEFDTATIVNTGPAGGGGGALGTTRYLGGLPSGTLDRSYTFTSTVESWTTNFGTLSSTSSRLQLTHTSGAVALEPSGVSSVANGEVECEYRTTLNTGSASIVFRATDTSNYYMIVFQPATVSVLYKCVAGAFTAIRSGTDLIAGGITGPFQILVRFNGVQLEAYVNGTLTAAIQDSTFTTGRCGIRVDNATMQVDDYKVYTSPVTTGNEVVA